ncbi:galactose oxidase [Sulfolobales archaeon HS-7]|nr:galactose oxidase [Sulfolobales archaeon HS-7]
MKKTGLLLLICISFATPLSALVITEHQLAQTPLPISSTASVYYEGKIILFINNNNGTETLPLIYNGTWHYGTPLHIGITGENAIVCNNEVYLVGGTYVSTGKLANTIEIYNGSHWTVINTSMPMPVYGAASLGYSGKIFLFGGVNSSYALAEGIASDYSNIIQVYDTATNTWQVLTEKLPVGIAFASYLFNGSVFFMVGGSYGVHALNSVFAFNPATGLVSELAPLPYGLEGEGLAYIHNELFSIGGMVFESVIHPSSKILALEGNTSWIYVWNMSEPVYDMAYVQVNSSIYLIGGYNSTNIEISNVNLLNFVYPPSSPRIINYASGNQWIFVEWTNVSPVYYLVLNSSAGISTILTYNNYYNVTDLQNGIQYYIYVVPHDIAGNGTPSNTIKLTPSTIPNQPVISYKLGNDNITLFWVPGYNGGLSILGYYITLSNNTYTKTFWVGNTTNFTLTGLFPNDVYYVRIIAENPDGNSTPAMIKFTSITIPHISASMVRIGNKAYIKWKTTEPANLTLLVYLNGKSIYNSTVSGTEYMYILNSYGNYTFVIQGANVAGSSFTEIKTLYYPTPVIPNYNISYENGTLIVKINESSYFKYQVLVNNTQILLSSAGLGKIAASPGLYLIQIIVYNQLGNYTKAVIPFLIKPPVNTNTSSTITISNISISNTSSSSVNHPIVLAGGTSTKAPSLNPFIVYSLLALIIIGAIIIILKK